MLDMSRCVVGSSMSSKFGGSSRSFSSASRLFSPPLRTPTFLHIIAAEQETAQEGADELLCEALRCVEGFFEHGAVGLEHVHPILGVVAGFGIVAQSARALLGREDAGQDF